MLCHGRWLAVGLESGRPSRARGRRWSGEVWRGGGERGRGIKFGEQAVEVEPIGDHGDAAVWRAWPLVDGAIAVEFDAVAVRIAEIERLADAVVGGTVEGDAGAQQAGEGIGEGGAGWVHDGEVVEAGGAGRGGAAGAALPGVEADVVVVAAGGEKGGGIAEAEGHGEAEHIAIEAEGALEIGDLEVHVADACFWVDGRCEGGFRCWHAVEMRGGD